jgi:acetyltransferase-like isoleucine patch superfamily enzyme
MTIEWSFIGEGARVFDPHLSIFLKPENIFIGHHSRLDGMVKIEGGEAVTICSHVHISSFVHINVGGGRVRIGDYTAIASGASVFGGTNTLDGRSMSSAAPADMQVIERGFTDIGDFVMVGTCSVIMPGVTIGRYAVVGAGAVVTKDVPPYAIVAGVPARQIGDRRQREGWHWGDGDSEALPVPDALEHEAEIVKRAIERKWGVVVTPEYAADFAAFIGGKYAA